MKKNSLISINNNGEVIKVKSGTALFNILPTKINNFTVVAALLNNKAVSLNTHIYSDTDISPLTTEHWEGERIYRRSVTFLLLEAARQQFPEFNFELGASIGIAQWIQIKGLKDERLGLLTEKISLKMQELIKENISFRVESWPTEKAIKYFNENDKTEVASFLHIWNQAKVSLISCNAVYFLSMGPLVPCAGFISNFQIKPVESGLILLAGETKGPDFTTNTVATYAKVVERSKQWLNSMNITTVGSLNHACVRGNISQIITVAEGFHEKSIGQIADAIFIDKKKPRIICIAGPSSSGKTTFIKRLSVQLQVNGLLPFSISLDNYYIDRDKTIRDEKGNYYFEALEALDLPLLRQHLNTLLKGETVKTAKYLFTVGKSVPEGGDIINLPENGILLLEGIHGLNPELIGNAVNNNRLFKIFIQPMNSLPFDAFSRVNPSDLRLLRRIIRDRYTRGQLPEDNIMRWYSVREGEKKHIYPYINQADIVFDSSLIYELSVLKVYGERYLLEVPNTHPAYTTAFRLRYLLNQFVSIYPDHVPRNSILREFIGGSTFEY